MQNRKGFTKEEGKMTLSKETLQGLKMTGMYVFHA